MAKLQESRAETLIGEDENSLKESNIFVSKGTEFDRKENATVVLKILKDSSNINPAFIKELQNIVKNQPNSNKRHLVQCFGVSYDPNTNNYIFVISYMSHGSLNEYLSRDFKNIFGK
ncbi:hypothetical protein C2G38_2160256 [Gigaspora rosea]|uniref:Serine-threonine/tyrosine-protein kinase catalytic domain-containing protein n=1 Tax=Gigaspora rosea TaxID=44941 RepID=A0A397W0F2_9GLOM|nr:hypothetical protein C2G38_2160256 [Gigaspora rosea]